MDEKLVCEICGKETDCVTTEDERVLCEDCLEAEGYEQCDGCKEYFKEFFMTGDDRILCEDCLYHEDYSQCDICQEFYKDCITNEDGIVMCPTCKAENPSLLDLMDSCRYVLETVNFEVVTYDEALQTEVIDKIHDILNRAVDEQDEEAKKTIKKFCDCTDGDAYGFFFHEDEDVENDDGEDDLNYYNDMVEEYIQTFSESPEILEMLGYDVNHISFNQGAHGHDCSSAYYIE